MVNTPSMVSHRAFMALSVLSPIAVAGTHIRTGRIGLVVSPSATVTLAAGGAGSVRGWNMTLKDCVGACGHVVASVHAV